MSDVQATTAGPPPQRIPPKLDVSEAARMTWRVFKRQPWRFIAFLFIPVLVVVPIQVLVGVSRALIRVAAGRDGGTAIAVTIVFTLIVFVVQYGAQFTCQLAALWGAARSVEGVGFTIGEALRVGFSRLLPYVGLILLTLAIVVIGFILLIVPGIIAAGFLVVAPAACVIERRGPIESIKRSVALVKGNWWRSLGVGLLVIFLPVLAFAAVGLVAYLIFAAMGVKALTLILILPGIPFFLVLVAVATVLPGVLFAELRSLHEGRSQGDVAGVFD